MRTLFTLGLALLITGAVSACPASFVKNEGNKNIQTESNSKAQQVADGYMTDRGIQPDSPSGKVVRPYVVGTAIVEDRYFNRDFLDQPVDQAIKEALGPNNGVPWNSNEPNNRSGHGTLGTHQHFNRHFNNGMHEAGGPGATPTRKVGG